MSTNSPGTSRLSRRVCALLRPRSSPPESHAWHPRSAPSTSCSNPRKDSTKSYRLLRRLAEKSSCAYSRPTARRKPMSLSLHPRQTSWALVPMCRFSNLLRADEAERGPILSREKTYQESQNGSWLPMKCSGSKNFLIRLFWQESCCRMAFSTISLLATSYWHGPYLPASILQSLFLRCCRCQMLRDNLFLLFSFATDCDLLDWLKFKWRQKPQIP